MRFVCTPLVLLAAAAVASADGPVDYTRDIKPILRQHCVACHGAKVTKSKLRLDTAALALKGGSSGPAIVPGKASESLLIDAVKGNGMERMPLKASALNANACRSGSVVVMTHHQPSSWIAVPPAGSGIAVVLMPDRLARCARYSVESI